MQWTQRSKFAQLFGFRMEKLIKLFTTHKFTIFDLICFVARLFLHHGAVGLLHVGSWAIRNDMAAKQTVMAKYKHVVVEQ